jgi:hypothetical protein
MKKLFAVLTMAMVASSAFGQATLPGGKRTLPDVPDIAALRIERNVDILQVMHCGPSDGSLLPPGITDTSFCLDGPKGKTGAVTPTIPACRFVGGVLCIDPGPNSDFANWLVDGPENTTAVLQGAKLRKIEPRVPKCPDIYPGLDFTQTGASPGLRTFWALKYTPCNTTFRLDLEVGYVSNTFPRHLVQIRQLRWNFNVRVRPESLRYVVEALHCQPLGTCEVPCITDEGLFQRLLDQADDIKNTAAKAKAGDQGQLLLLNDALDRMEAMIVRYCFFTDAVWSISDKTGALIPCDIFGNIIPGNKTVATFGFGIVDTFEHPCCCKLIADLHCLKTDLIGTDP